MILTFKEHSIRGSQTDKSVAGIITEFGGH